MAFSIIQNFIDKFSYPRRCPACTGPFGLVPQELLDHIISYLANDNASLLSCALVHPTWTSISRYHLVPLGLVVSTSSHAYDYAKLLRSSRETLSSSITGIKLVGDIPFYGWLCFIDQSRVPSYSELLHVLVAKGIVLRIGAVENDPSLVHALADYFPALTALKVACASYHDITSFMRALVGSFLWLAQLTIGVGATALGSPDASVSGLRDVRLDMPCLRTLRVEGWNNQLVRWLGDNIVGTLERLELETASVLFACRFGEANHLLQGNKNTLKHVRLMFFYRNVTFDLSGLTCLENLEVASGMRETHLALDGWRLPRSLKRVFLRNMIRVVRGRWCEVGDDSEEGMLFEGADLHTAFGSCLA